MLADTCERGDSKKSLPYTGYGLKENMCQWSKATYTYGVAVCLLQLGGDKRHEEAKKLMAKVPNLRQRIAGKSIPLEVLPFCALSAMHSH